MSVLTTSMLVTIARKKAIENTENGKNLGITFRAGENNENPRSNLARVLYIWYPIAFRKKSILACFDSSSEVNTIYPNFTKELSLFIRPTGIKEQKIDGTTLDTYKMVVAAFLMTKKANQVRFFEETFLVANVSPKIVFGTLFLTLSGADIDFLDWKFR